MVPNYSYPWYIQHSPHFTKVYDQLYDLVSMASPLGIGDAFNIKDMTGSALTRLGILWGLQGAPQYYNGLIYKIDKWSDVKVWSGHAEDIEGALYKNFILMHAYINGRQYNLQLIKEAIAMLLGDAEYTLSVDEEYMSFTINLSAAPDVLRVIQQLQSYDRHFIGKPSGISYTFNYIPMEQQG